MLRYEAKGVLRRAVAAQAGNAHELAWLSVAERAACVQLTDASRREDWLLGRWLLKQMVAKRLRDERADRLTDPESLFAYGHIEILPRRIGGLSARPSVVVKGQPLPWCVSLSHIEGGILAAVMTRDTAQIGVDLVTMRPLRGGFLRLWFTSREQHWLRSQANPECPALVWGAKEATYKACNQGGRFLPRQIEIEFVSPQRWRGHYLGESTATAEIEWMRVSPTAWAVVATADVSLGERRRRNTDLSLLQDACR